MVRAKFKLDSTSSTLMTKKIDQSKGWENENLEEVELKTLKLSPVYSNGDPNHENSKFWEASPAGSIELGILNKEVWDKFELGKEYYVDFTPAE